MKYKYIFAFDPSGNYNEGKGTTGWVLMDWNENLLERGYISAEQYSCAEEYWQGHVDLIYKYNKRYRGQLIIVVEDYVLYRDRSVDQTNSRMETCRLLGVLQYHCWRLKQPYTMQLAASVKQRWADELLCREGILYRTGHKFVHNKSGLDISLIHTRDAFRHAIHYVVTRNKTKGKFYKPINNNFRKSNYREWDYE